MKISVKRYSNDVSRAYRVMMRKLNAEGYYTDTKRKAFYISKSEKAREDKKSGIARYRKAESKRVALLDKLEQKQGFTKPKKTYNSDRNSKE
jgi:hypothetical protein